MEKEAKKEVIRKGDMTQGPILKQMIFFALPMMIGALFQLMYNTTDSVIVGKFVGADALAAIGATATTTFGLFHVTMGVTSAFTVVIAQQYGAREEEKMRNSVLDAMWISIVMSVLTAIVSVFGARPLMELLGTPADIIDQSVIYVQIYGGLMVGMIFYNSATCILKGVGDSKTSLYFLIFASLLNIVLDLLFVLKWQMGVAGVGWATVIAQIVSAILCLVYMFAKYPELRIKGSFFRVDRDVMKEMLRIGIPLGLTNGLLTLGMLVVTSVVNHFGSAIVAVYTVGNRVQQIATVSFSQLAFSTSVFAGQNFGAKQYDRVLEGTKKGAATVVAISFVSAVAIYFAARPVALLFLNADEVAILKDTVTMIRITSFFYVFLGAIWVYNHALRGVGAVRATIISSIVELASKVGLSILLAYMFGHVGIWYAEPIGWFLGVIVSAVFFYQKKWIPES